MAENEYAAKKVILKNNQGEYLIPYVEFPIATETSAGIVQPDNSTITIENGLVSTGKNVYTKESLVAGAGLGLIEASDGGIDENTIACWHFENTLNDSVNNIPFYAGEQFDSEYSKEGFGSSLSWMYNGSTTVTNFAPGTGDYTLDLQLLRRDSIAYFELYIQQYSLYFNGTSVYVYDRTTGNGLSNTYTIEVGNWYHVAIQRKDGLVQFFLNGIKIYEIEQKDSINIFFINCSTNQAGYIRLDEVRVSNIARYISPFNPPTKPYTDIISSANTLKVLTDNQTLTVNDGVLSAEGIKTKNAVLKYDWIGTKAEWEAGRENGTILDEWVCYITDDFVQTDTSGTRNYNELENKPTIGGIELKGNKELGELGIQSKLTAGENITISEEGVISAISNSSSSSEIGNVTGDKVNVTYTHDLEEVTTDLNSFASSVDADLSNLTELVGDSYTQNNLVGSENVQIVDETEGNGDINSNTNLYITFDEPNTFEDKSLKQTKFQVLNNPSDIVLTEGVFGTGLESCSSGNITLKNETNLTTNSLQNVAFWFKMPQVFGRLRVILTPNESTTDLTQAAEMYEIRYQEGTNENGNIIYFLAANQNSLANSAYAVQTGYYYNNLINGVINESGWNYIVFTKIGEQFAITLNGNQLYSDIPTYAFVNSEFNTVMLTSTATADGVNYIYNIDELNIINNNFNYWNIQTEQSTPIVLTGKKQIQQNKLLTTDTHQSISGSKSFESFTYFMGGVNVISNFEKQINIHGESYQTPIIMNQNTFGITDGEVSNISTLDYGTLKSQQKVSVNSSEGTTTTEIKSCVDGLNTTGLSIVAYTNGNGYAALDNIALSDEDNSNKIPTTAWVNQRIESHTPTNVVTGTGITQIVRLTQSEYDALATKDENTFYVIVGE